MAAALACLSLMFASSAAAQEELCDNSFQDCRAKIKTLIENEQVGIDVSFWFMDDYRYKDWLIAAWKRGVDVRIILDLRADGYGANKALREALIAAGIPIRHKTTAGTGGINHWKMMLYHGQNKVHFSGANFSNGSYSYTTKYTGYVDEAIYFTDDAKIVESFMRKYDDLWLDTVDNQNLANINGPLTRSCPTCSISSPDLNFPPNQDYQDRVVARLKQETEAVDAVIFRITSPKIPDELIKRVQAGVSVRLITDQAQYRNTKYFWDSYNVDRMYVAGIENDGRLQLKWKDKASGQDMHQKSLSLHSLRMSIFGSSNWTSSSSDTQREHNYFSPPTPDKLWIFDWFVDQFNRKWNNLKPSAPFDNGGPITPPPFQDFVPGWPEPPANASPANAALGLGTSVPLKWEGGWWAHKYDIYFGTTNPPPLIAQDFMPSSATAGVSSNKETFNPCAPPAPFTTVCPSGLAPGTTYYWKVRGKTMVGNSRAVTGPTWSFTTSGGAPPPPAPGGLVASPVSSTRIDLTWTDVAGEDGYKVERKLAGSSTWAQIGTTGPNLVAYQDTSGLTPSTQYNYRVRAWTTGGNSGYTNTATATTAAVSAAAGLVVADAYVRSGQYASTNYGRATELIAKYSADALYHRQSFIKLDISQVTDSTQSAVLRIAAKLSDTRAPSVRADIYAGTNVSWNETTINWNNKPAVPTATGVFVVASGTTAQWTNVDLTEFIKQQRALDPNLTMITIALISPVDTLPYASFGSRESSTRPELIITP